VALASSLSAQEVAGVLRTIVPGLIIEAEGEATRQRPLLVVVTLVVVVGGSGGI
jgi:hypothetical protein